MPINFYVMRKLTYFLPLGLSVLFMTACERNLSESELDIIRYSLPDKIYASNIEDVTEDVQSYLWEAVDMYANQLFDETQKDIDDYNSTSALFGGSLFDFNELVGSSAPEQYAKRYYKFVDYANDKRDIFDEDCERISRILQQHPEVIDEFSSGNSSISLSLFQTIGGLPSSISADRFESFRSLELNKSNRAKWGELVMGKLKNPSYSPLAVLCAMVIRVERLKYPEPVYIVYQKGEDFDDEDGWEVGYDTQQAFFITFDEDEDIIEYFYEEVDYFEGYVNSKKNILK